MISRKPSIAPLRTSGGTAAAHPSSLAPAGPSRMAALAVAVAAVCAAVPVARAQSPVPEDGRWRGSFGAGASFASGNTSSRTLSLNADATRATPDDKLSLVGSGLYAKSDGETTGAQLRLGGRYDHDLSERWFGFGSLDLERDQVAELDLRSIVGGGVGYHLIQQQDHLWDLFGGLGYTDERYAEPTFVDDRLRERYGYASLLLGEESTHRFNETVSGKQKLVVYPNLRNRGEYRATLDATLSVAMTQQLALNVGLSVRHNSDPGIGLKSTDTLLTTGVSMKFE